MRQIGIVLAFLSVAGCASSPSYIIHNPEIYASVQPEVDDNGVPLAIPIQSSSQSWMTKNSHMAD